MEGGGALLTYVSLCDGIGAVHVAWNPLGWRCAWVSEIAPFPAAVVDQRWGFKNLGDMRLIRSIYDEEAVDLVAGGTPCQSFSIAGLRKGLADPRGNLALVFLGLVDRLRPRWVLWENVPGVLSSSGGRDFGAFLGALAQLGYGFAFRVLDAQFFGVPQRRRRVLVVGHSGGWRPAVQVLFESQSLRGDSAPRPPARQAVARTLTSSTGGCSGKEQQHTFIGGNGRPLNALCMAHGQAGAEIAMELSPTLSCNHEAPIVASPDVSLPAYTFQPRIGRCGRGAPSPVVPTLTVAGATSDSGSCVVNGPAVRRLTPREYERLQGFPDDYTLIELTRRQRRSVDAIEARYLRRTHPQLTDDQIAHMVADSPRYRALGNSMAVPVMAWIGKRIDQVDRKFQTKTPAGAGVEENL